MFAKTRPLAADVPVPPPHRRTLAAYLGEARDRHPSRRAVVQGSTILTYRQLWDGARALASALRAAGVTDGDVVTYQLPNWWETALLSHAVPQSGAVSNPVIPIYRHAELAFMIGRARPKVIVVPHLFRGVDHVEMIRQALTAVGHEAVVVVVRPGGPLPDGFLPFEPLLDTVPGPGPERLAPDDVAFLLYTSGTEGDPKGVLHSQATALYRAATLMEAIDVTEDDIFFMASPLTHVTGLMMGIHAPAVVGGTSVLMDVWDPVAAVDLIEGNGCTFTAGATPFLQGMAAEYERRGTRSTLRKFSCGGADAAPEVIRRAAAAMGTSVFRAYGLSEHPGFCMGVAADGPESGATTDGRPIPPTTWRLEDIRDDGVGHLLIRGPEQFLGYSDPALNAAAFTADGYFRTGDLARVDERGLVTICGRLKDIIIRGGQNISAMEVENVLYEHPAVLEVAVIAMPDVQMGERACACVVLRPGHQLTFDDMVAHMASRQVARQKFPEHMVVLDALPKTASGKIQKYALRQQVVAHARA